LPSDAFPVNVAVERDRYCTPAHIPIILPSDPVTVSPSTWAAFLASLPLWERSLFPDVNVLDLPALLIALEDNVTFYLASDGGAIPFKGSFGCY
jgi:hypothetical protein